MIKKIIILSGPPGSGKGSISQLCNQRLGTVPLSTGSLCRKHIAEKTLIGREIDFSIKSGKLISDDLIVGMVEDWLVKFQQPSSKVILDGFPRTVAQASALLKFVQEKLPEAVVKIVRLSVDDDVVLKRIAGRFVCININCQAVYALHNENDYTVHRCKSCTGTLSRRSDDDQGTIVKRLKTYRATENILHNFYVDTGYVVKDINVDRPLDHVFFDVEQLVLD